MSVFYYHPGPSERCVISDGDSERELHCGDCFTLRRGAERIPVRIELAADWFFVGATTTEEAEYWDGCEVLP